MQHKPPQIEKERGVRMDSELDFCKNEEKSMRPFDDMPLEAKAISRMICVLTGRTVGVEYLWDNGETSTLWIDETSNSIERCPIIPNAKTEA